MRLNVLDGLDIIAFARRAYRIPTFNELYYVGYGNPDLKPEDAWLTGLGLDFNKVICSSWTIKSSLDGFYNILTDKITSAPTLEDPNIWLPYNIGKVRSAGFNISAGFVHKGEWNYSLNAEYTLQSAIDITPDSYTYGQQIPYIAKHVVALCGSVSWKGWMLEPTWQMRTGRTDGYGKLPDWNTLDLTLSKTFIVRNAGMMTLKAAARNLADSRYETVSGYPMPGRTFMCGAEFKF